VEDIGKREGESIRLGFVGNENEVEFLACLGIYKFGVLFLSYFARA
jgi:hypothetical protein